MLLEKDSQGHPIIKANSNNCYLKIDHLDIYIHGDHESWLYGLISPVVGDILKKLLEEKVLVEHIELSHDHTVIYFL